MKKIVATILILILVLALCGCGTGKSAAGVWQMSGLKSNGKDYTGALRFKGLSVTLVLEEDGTGSVDLAGEKTALTWDETGISVNGAVNAFELEGDTLILSEGDSELVFTRK